MRVVKLDVVEVEIVVDEEMSGERENSGKGKERRTRRSQLGDENRKIKGKRLTASNRDFDLLPSNNSFEARQPQYHLPSLRLRLPQLRALLNDSTSSSLPSLQSKAHLNLPTSLSHPLLPKEPHISHNPRSLLSFLSVVPLLNLKRDRSRVD